MTVQTKMLNDAECTACYSSPCQNGGVCKIDDNIQLYRCECPDDYAGQHCETKIECDKWTCGENAQCFVQNHQTNCVCNKGFTGNARSGCRQSSKKICFNGDPHYTSLDYAYFDYQGTCPYIFSQPCTQLGGDFHYFSVKAKNERQEGDYVSNVQSCQVEMYNKTIYVNRNLEVFVDEYLVYVPYYWPNKDMPQITITMRGREVVIKSDEFVEVDFSNTQLCLSIPDIPEFQGSDRLCGIAGNTDGVCTDDFRLKNGTTIPLAGCRPNQKQTDDFGDDWITLEYPASVPNVPCLDGKSMTKIAGTCNTENAMAACQSIWMAENGTGPFAVCQDMGMNTIQQAYDSCLYDVCRDPTLKCQWLSDFVHSCQEVHPEHDFDGWRSHGAVGTPDCQMNCPEFSSYSSCVSSCPATCADHYGEAECNDPCVDGCGCDAGYVLDTTRPELVTCIRIQECGCVDDFGGMHPADIHWLSSDCQQDNYCSNGTYVKLPYHCPQYAVCGIRDNAAACVCDIGFEWDAAKQSCVDINECDDPKSCSQGDGYGTCTNTIGSYTCDCKLYYGGHDCETYGPMRHCADLYVYHGKRADGVYTVYPPYEGKNESLNVYCEMNLDGEGGWTLIGNALTNETAGKTVAEYAVGWGQPEIKSVWLGLDLMNLYTNYQESSLRLNLYNCPNHGIPEVYSDCTYPKFLVKGKEDDYKVVIPQYCTGSAMGSFDGWVRWDVTGDGPAFVSFDNDPSTAHCSETYRETGWWFDAYRCGAANLNGVRFTCDNIPVDDDIHTYLQWNGNPVNKAEMLLRPAGFPNYE